MSLKYFLCFISTNKQTKMIKKTLIRTLETLYKITDQKNRKWVTFLIKSRITLFLAKSHYKKKTLFWVTLVPVTELQSTLS